MGEGVKAMLLDVMKRVSSFNAGIYLSESEQFQILMPSLSLLISTTRMRRLLLPLFLSFLLTLTIILLRF